jgi:hypothetical protein
MTCLPAHAQLFEQAANGGKDEAWYYVGAMYEYATGSIAQNFDKAMDAYTRGCASVSHLMSPRQMHTVRADCIALHVMLSRVWINIIV